MGPLPGTPVWGPKRGDATYTLQNVDFVWRGRRVGLAGVVRVVVAAVAGAGAVALAPPLAFALAALGTGSGGTICRRGATVVGTAGATVVVVVVGGWTGSPVAGVGAGV